MAVRPIAGAAVLLAFLAGCAGKEVRTQIVPEKGGINRAFARHASEGSAEDAAYHAARDYCKKRRLEVLEVNRHIQPVGTEKHRMYEASVFFKCEIP